MFMLQVVAQVWDWRLPRYLPKKVPMSQSWQETKKITSKT